jgi:hypothetical protein
MVDMTNRPDPANLADLRAEFETQISIAQRVFESSLAGLREEIAQARLQRAERYADYMRNWLALLTFTVTIAFVIFGILGYTHYSDIESFRKQIEKTSAGVTEDAAKVSNGANTVQNVLGNLEPRVGSLETKIGGLESRYQQSDEKLTRAVNRTSVVTEQTRSDLLASVSSGALGLNFPTISHVTLGEAPAECSIEGTNFGDSPGRVYFEIQSSNFTTLNSGLPKTVEVKGPFNPWTSSKIGFMLSPDEYQAIKANQPKEEGPLASASILNSAGVPNVLTGYTNLTVRVVTSSGNVSIITPILSWPR